eukprot:303138-Rhodomonas_salina.1
MTDPIPSNPTNKSRPVPLTLTPPTPEHGPLDAPAHSALNANPCDADPSTRGSWAGPRRHIRNLFPLPSPEPYPEPYPERLKPSPSKTKARNHLGASEACWSGQRDLEGLGLVLGDWRLPLLELLHRVHARAPDVPQRDLGWGAS